MQNLVVLKKKLQLKMPEINRKYYIKQLGLFGSYLRGQADENSDLDILVSFNKTPSLLEFSKLENDLSDYLEVKVDLVMKESLKPVIGKDIMDSVQFL